MPPLVPRDIDARVVKALQAEFIGTLLFQLLASLSGTSWGNGLSLAILIYATQASSGGHLNPAFSIAMAVSGHMHWMKALLYVLAQILGAVVGALLEVALMPGLQWAWFGHNKVVAPGCVYPGAGVNHWEVFGWELILTFVLVYVIYAVAVAEPGHGNVGPLVIGLTVWVGTEAGARFSGAGMNPARVIGPAFIFLCTSQRSLWFILAGEILGGMLAAGMFAGSHGIGSSYMGGYQAVSGREDPLLGTTNDSPHEV